MLDSEKLSVTWQRMLAARKANHILGCIKSSMGSRLREGILPIYSALVRAHLESRVQLWSPQHRTDMDLLEQVQRRPTKILRDGRPLVQGQAERVRAVQPEEEKAPGRPCSSLPIPEGTYNKAGEGLLIGACSDRTRGDGFKLKEV